MPTTPQKATHDYKRHGTLDLFAALEVATGRVIADLPKSLRPGLPPSLLARFDREVAALTGIRSRIVVPALDHGVQESRPYVVMPAVRGVSVQYALHNERADRPRHRVGRLRPIAHVDRGEPTRPCLALNALSEETFSPAYIR